MEVLYRSQKEVIGLIRSLIKSLNLSKFQRALKTDNTFKVFVVECVQEIVKDEISVVVSNLKLSVSSSKISPNVIEGFSILTIDNKHIKSAPILQSLLRALAHSIDILSHSFCWGIENLDGNIESDKNEVEEARIELEDEMNQDVLIHQTNKASNQHWRDSLPTVILCMLSYTQNQRSNIY